MKSIKSHHQFTQRLIKKYRKPPSINKPKQLPLIIIHCNCIRISSASVLKPQPQPHMLHQQYTYNNKNSHHQHHHQARPRTTTIKSKLNTLNCCIPHTNCKYHIFIIQIYILYYNKFIILF